MLRLGPFTACAYHAVTSCLQTHAQETVKACPASVTEAEVVRAEEEEAMAGHVELLQASKAHLPPKWHRSDWLLSIARPVMWVHIPKCGTSFLNTLMISTLCSGIPRSAMLDGVAFGDAGKWLAAWDPETYCPGSFFESQDLAYHVAIGEKYVPGRRNGLIFLRQPEQRLISDISQRASDTPGYLVQDLLYRVTEVRGCQTKFLVRSGSLDHCQDSGPEATYEEVQIAKIRLRDGFAFIGITDEWNLSICLFNLMFGQKFLDEQFQNTRPGDLAVNTSSTMIRKIPGTDVYDTDILKGYTDELDGELFAEALHLFQSSLQQYGASSAACADAASRDGSTEAEFGFRAAAGGK